MRRGLFLAAAILAAGLIVRCGQVTLPPVNDPNDDPSVLPPPRIDRTNPYEMRGDGGP